MTPEISERSFEEAIECGLLQDGPDACAGETAVRETPPPYGYTPPGGYRKRRPEDYDRALCLLPRDVVDFVLATQPKEWKKLAQHHGAGVKEQFLKRLASEIERRGALDVLRLGMRDSGCKFRVAYFRPASGLNEETRRLYAANLFAVVRQLRYSEKNDPPSPKLRRAGSSSPGLRPAGKSLDLVLFINGIPIFTAELKNPLNGQDIEDAIRQYKSDRDPREPLLAYGRCLAHFAVDPDLVYVTTQLAGPKTRFLPFNQGKFGGAGNPPVPPTQNGYPTGYLWEETWARESVLDLIRQFIHEVEEQDEKGRKTGTRSLIFPRYQQLDAVRRLVAHARGAGMGQRYLIQHSAGSGKSFTIAWLAHQLATLHDATDRRVFDSIVVITDRRVLDRQLQTTMRQFEQTLGVAENIDTTSRQLKQALEAGKTIIVTTLQKFPDTRENVRLTFDQKVEYVIQEIVDSNFELYKRITDDRAFGEASKNFLFDQYLRAHRNAEDLIKRGESKTLEFKSTLRWSLKEDRQDDKGVTHAVLKTIAGFLNTEGGDLLIGVADDGKIVGIERDQLESDDKFMRHLSQVVRNGLGDRAGTCIDPKTQIVQGKTVFIVSCQRSPEPVFLRWKGLEASEGGDLFVRSGPGTVKLPPESASEYIRTRFPGAQPPAS